MTKLTFVATLAAFGIGASAFAQDTTAPRPQGQRAGQGRGGVQVCAMKGEALKTPSKAESVEFNGKKVLFCCVNCKGAFEKLDDAAKTKTVTRAGLISRKLTAQRTLEQVEKQLKELDGVKEGAKETPPPAGKLQCAVTGEEIESAAKAAGKIEHNGKTFYFCCEGCIKKFKENPAKFAK